MIDQIASVVLAIANTPFYILALAAGYLFYDKPVFARVLFILLLTGPFNAYLKSIWQIPLPIQLGDGWSFPSGHMQSCIVFWGWLGLELNKKWFYTIAAVIATFVGCSLVIKGYHTPIDIAGAVFFGVLSLYMYQIIIKKVQEDKQYFIGVVFSILSIGLIYLNPKHHASLGVAPGSLLAFSIGWHLNQKHINQEFFNKLTIFYKILSLAVGVAVIFVIQQKFLSGFSSFWQQFLSTTFLSLWVSFGIGYALKTIQERKPALAASSL